MFPGNQEAAQDDAATHDDSADARYMVRNPLQVRQLLRQLIEQRSLINAHIGGRDQSFPTAVLELHEETAQLLLDGSPQDVSNQAAVQAGFLLCFAQLERVQVRFRVDVLRHEQNGRHAALRASMPDEVLHLQRRELYRLETPISASPQLLLAIGDDRAETLAMRVVDISGGGLAVMMPLDCPVFSLQKRYMATLCLPDGPDLEIGLVACNERTQQLPNGIEAKRVGLRFDGLPRGGDSAIQRYIFRIDRQRSARRNGEL